MNKVYTDKPKENKALFFEVPSATIPDRKYMIRVMPDGEIRCACIANTMGHICTHIKYFEKMYNPKYEKLLKDIDSSELVKYKESLVPQKEKKVREKKGDKIFPKEKSVPKGFAEDFPF